jgi:hypothetical protein
MQALSIACDTGSARIMRELRTLDAQLTERWSGHPASRALRNALAA